MAWRIGKLKMLKQASLVHVIYWTLSAALIYADGAKLQRSTKEATSKLAGAQNHHNLTMLANKQSKSQRENSFGRSRASNSSDQWAQEQRLAVHIITTDGQVNYVEEPAASGGGAATAGPVRLSRADSQQQHQQMRQKAPSDNPPTTTTTTTTSLNVGPLSNFDEQFVQLERALNREAPDDVERRVAPANNQSTNQHQLRAILPKRILINLGETSETSQQGASNVGARLTIGFSPNRRAGPTSYEQQMQQTTATPPPPPPPSPPPPPKQQQQQSKLPRDSGKRFATEPPPEAQRKSTRLEKKASVKEQQQQVAEPRRAQSSGEARTGGLRAAVTRALSEQGGVPAMVMSEADMNDALANGGNMQAMERQRKMTKLMLGAEMIDRMRQQQQQQQQQQAAREETGGAVQAAQTNSLESEVSLLESELTLNDEQQAQSSTSGLSNHGEQFDEPLDEAAQFGLPEQQQQQQQQEYLLWPSATNLGEQVESATSGAALENATQRVEQQQQQHQRQPQQTQTGNDKQRATKTEAASRPARSSGSLSQKESSSPQQQQQQQQQQQLARGKEASKQRLGQGQGATMDERVARLLGRLKLYTTKEHLMKVARDLQQPSGGARQIGEAQQPQMLVNEMNLADHFATIPGVPGQSQQAIEQSLAADQTRAAASTHFEREALTRMARNQVPGPINYNADSERPAVAVPRRREATEPRANQLASQRAPPTRRVNEVESLLDPIDEERQQQVEEQPRGLQLVSDLSSESSQGGAQATASEANNLPGQQLNANENDAMRNSLANIEERQAIYESGGLVSGPNENDENDNENGNENENGDEAAAELHGASAKPAEDELQTEDTQRSEEPASEEAHARGEREPLAPAEAQGHGEQQQQQQTTTALPDEEQPALDSEEAALDERYRAARARELSDARDDGATPEQEIKALEQVIDELIERERQEKRDAGTLPERGEANKRGAARQELGELWRRRRRSESGNLLIVSG